MGGAKEATLPHPSGHPILRATHCHLRFSPSLKRTSPHEDEAYFAMPFQEKPLRGARPTGWVTQQSQEGAASWRRLSVFLRGTPALAWPERSHPHSRLSWLALRGRIRRAGGRERKRALLGQWQARKEENPSSLPPFPPPARSWRRPLDSSLGLGPDPCPPLAGPGRCFPLQAHDTQINGCSWRLG